MMPPRLFHRLSHYIRVDKIVMKCVSHWEKVREENWFVMVLIALLDMFVCSNMAISLTNTCKHFNFLIITFESLPAGLVNLINYELYQRSQWCEEEHWSWVRDYDVPELVFQDVRRFKFFCWSRRQFYKVSYKMLDLCAAMTLLSLEWVIHDVSPSSYGLSSSEFSVLHADGSSSSGRSLHFKVGILFFFVRKSCGYFY